jgi:osmotically-inducible protein OsmY
MIRRVASLLFVSAIILALILPLLAAQSQGKGSDDDRIYDEVRRRLANDRDVKGAGFDVMVVNGVVTLKGRVSN